MDSAVDFMTWLSIERSTFFGVIVSAIGIYSVLLLYTRMTGLRSFSKMSSFDFAITIALGSIIAATALNPNPSLLTGMLTMGMFYCIQWLISKSRRMTQWVSKVVDNEPLLLMVNGEYIAEHMTKARVTEDDLHAKLRQAGVMNVKQVRAVVLETTGDVSVIQQDENHSLDPALFGSVIGKEKLQYKVEYFV